jgi:hypothetical protein
MSHSQPLRVLLLLALGVTAAHAAEPTSALGAGSAVTCKDYLALLKHHQTVPTDLVLSWVQGYFTARNSVGRADQPVTVGHTISANTLQSLLADQCKDERMQPKLIALAADALYEKMQQKGL